MTLDERLIDIINEIRQPVNGRDTYRELKATTIPPEVWGCYYATRIEQALNESNRLTVRTLG